MAGIREGRGRRVRWRSGVITVVLLAATGAAGGVWWGTQQDRVGAATALVLVNPLEGNPFSPDAGGDRLVNLETEAQLVTSDAVGDLVADHAPPAAGESILAGVRVDVPPNTQLLEISVTHPVPEVARARAQAFADTYLAYRRARSEAAVFDRRAEIEERIQEHTRDLAARAAKLDAARRGSAEAVLLEQQMTDLTTQMGLLRTQAASLQAASSDPGQVVTAAALAGPGLLGEPVRAGVLGAALGLALAVTMIVARVRRDTRILHPDDLAETGLPVVACLRRDDDPSVRAKQVEGLRAAVLAPPPPRPFVLLVAGVGAGGGVGDGAAEDLSRGLGRAHCEVALVDLVAPPEDGRPTARGVSDILADRGSLDELLVSTAPHQWVLGPGTAPALLGDLVAAPQMATLVQDLRKWMDAVVLRVGDVETPDALVLVHHADAVLLEVVVGRTRTEDAVRAAELVAGAGSRLLGLVVVDEQARAGATGQTGETEVGDAAQ